MMRMILVLNDSLQHKRVDVIMTSLVQTIISQSKFWKITDLCIEHLCRMAKKSRLVYQWLQGHSSQLDTLIGWVSNHQEPPAPYGMRYDTPNRTSDIQLYKPGSINNMGGMSYGFAPRQKLAILTSIRQGKEVDSEGASDSDLDFSDRVLHLHDYVDVRDTANNWLCAQIIQCDGPKVLVHYEGWPDRWNEWIDVFDKRIRNLNTYTSKDITATMKSRKPQQTQQN